jgi:hypothetical protein
MSSIVRSGVFAIVSSRRQCACVLNPRSCARSARSFRISGMIVFVSCASPLLPRL